jgi:hypothetical protein
VLCLLLPDGALGFGKAIEQRLGRVEVGKRDA